MIKHVKVPIDKILTPSQRKLLFRKNRRTKLCEKDIKAIRKLERDGVKQKHIAEKFSISPGYVSRILSRDEWAHV